MAAKYCLNCGYKNQAMAKLVKCGKCGAAFETIAKDIIRIQKKEVKEVKIEEPVEEQAVEDSEFDSLIEGSIAQDDFLSKEEIEKVFLSQTSKGFNLRDYMQQELDKIAEASKQSKSKPKAKRGRKPK